ncbi:uncharacterized protein LOC133324780 [Musca vetustissima]|uniref:uncharacterized protein LOC133324780 n=1 Tax=Musca vetustissima TaxID=27455 RepID=UPI002AB775B4|nr:uncharacterized protein LOC133324780 [Musca vetustissima]
MKYFILIFILQLTATTFAAEIAGYFTDPDFPGACVYDDMIIWPDDVGHSTSGKCERLYCLNEEGYGKLLSCGVQKAPAGCWLGNVIKPESNYPDCCKREIVCPEK